MLIRIALVGLLALSGAAYAQRPGPARGPRGASPQIPGFPPEARLIGAFAGAPGEVVRNAPYSAETITETTQTLADGNRIRQVNHGKVYRDSEGRMRTEQTISGLGALMPNARLPEVAFIHDPVASVNYALNPTDRTASKSAWNPRGRPGPAAADRPRERRGRGPDGPDSEGRWRASGRPAGKSKPRTWAGRPSKA